MGAMGAPPGGGINPGYLPTVAPTGPAPGLSPRMPPPGPLGGPIGSPMGVDPTVPPTIPPKVPNLGGGGAPGASPMSTPGAVMCPRCGSPTPPSSAFCQQCGLHMGALQPTDPGANAPRARTPSSAGTVRPPVNVDPQGATIAQDGLRAGGVPAMNTPMAASGPSQPRPPSSGGDPAARQAQSWGTAVLVNRDGSDGERFALQAEYTTVGRSGADIAFDDDRFLARQHARIERANDGNVRITPMDTLNGVFRKTNAPTDLLDGMTVLVGREVLRYERVETEERVVHPLVRHGVALFGSPPREPWGRLVQIVPSGGYRDVRHLVTEEVVLGREEGDIVFRDDAFMSRRHAAVTWDGKKASITDLGSSNGTFVRVTGTTQLKHGDHIRMGDQLLRIELGR